MSDPRDELAVAGLFLQTYLQDRDAGITRPLADYQARFPGFEALIAREHGALAAGVARDATLPPDGTGATPAVAPLLHDVAARYELGDELARGGMGIVYRAFDRDLRRTIAMKVLPPHEAGDRGTQDVRRLSRFLLEARITGQLGHPGIVPVHALGIDDRQRAYFTMAMVEGRDFGAIIADVRAGDDPRWTLPRAVEVVLRVCEAMAFAHDRGVVHRDLKPANVMVGQFGETYVMDWGLARELAAADEPRGGPDPLDALLHASRTRTGDVFGTAAYMPPEQARGDVDAIDYRSDVYAIGAMLYELLTGRPPYDEPGGDNSSHAVLARVLQGPPRPIDRLARAPAELAAICEKAMRREPADRYGTVLELATDLRAFLEQRVVRAYEVGAVAEARKWVRRNRALAATGLAAVLLLIAGLLTSTTFARQATEQAAASQQSFELAAEAIERMLTEVGDRTLTNIPQMTPVRERLLAAAIEFQQQLIARRQDDPEALAAIARAHASLGRIHSLQGDLTTAQTDFGNALAVWSRLADTALPRPLQLARIDALRSLGNSFGRSGRHDDGLANNDLASAALAPLLAERPDDVELLTVQANLQDDRATILHNAGRPALAEQGRTAAIATLRRVLALGTHPAAERTLAFALRNQGSLASNQRRWPEAAALLGEAKDRFTRLVAAAPDVTLRDGLAATLNALQPVLLATEGPAASEATMRDAITIRRRLVDDFPSVARYRSELGGNLHNLANVLVARSEFAEAAALFGDALRHQDEALRLAPNDTIARRYRRMHLTGLTTTALRSGDHATAVRWATVSGSDPTDGSAILLAASHVGHAIGLVRRDGDLGTDAREQVASRYADTCLGLVRAAAQLGVDRGELLWSDDLAMIHDHPEFADLAARVDRSDRQVDRDDRERTRFADTACRFGQTAEQIEQLRQQGWRVTDLAVDSPATFAVSIVKDHADTARRWWWQPTIDDAGIAAFGAANRDAMIVDIDVVEAGDPARFAVVWAAQRRAWSLHTVPDAAALQDLAESDGRRPVCGVAFAAGAIERTTSVLVQNEAAGHRPWQLGGEPPDAARTAAGWRLTSLLGQVDGPALPIWTRGPPIETRRLTGVTAADIEAALAAAPGARVTTLFARRDLPSRFDALLVLGALRR